MKELKMRVTDFDLAGFIDELVGFLEMNGLSKTAIAWLSDYEDIPEAGPDWPDRNYRKELQREGRILYFPFSDINTGEPVCCADGHEYLLPVLEPSESELAFCAGEIESVGLLVRIIGDEIEIVPALLQSGRIWMASAAEGLEESRLAGAITEFVESFIKK
jgi:hypothetical protein